MHWVVHNISEYNSRLRNRVKVNLQYSGKSDSEFTSFWDFQGQPP